MTFMKRTKRLAWVVLAVCSCFFGGCTRHDEVLPNATSATASTSQALSHQDTNRVFKASSVPAEKQGTNVDYQRAKSPAAIDWEKVDKDNEERLRNPHPSDWPLPNSQTGPGRPLPNYVNFYTVDDSFPSYLLCEYAVKEERYDQSKESGWFKAALEQIRQSGPKRFPPIKWIAVAIRNVAEHKDASTFEQSFKVAAIFKASDAFDSSRDMSQMVAHVEMDRHPFLFDRQKPTPGEQQRWVIVERHAVTNRPTTGPN